MGKLTVKELLDLKGKRQISFVLVTSEEEAKAASMAGIDMMGTAFISERVHFPSLVPANTSLI